MNRLPMSSGLLSSRFIPWVLFVSLVSFSLAQTTTQPSTKTATPTAKKKKPMAARTASHPVVAHPAVAHVVPVAYHAPVHPPTAVAPKVVTAAPIIRGGPWTEAPY